MIDRSLPQRYTASAETPPGTKAETNKNAHLTSMDCTPSDSSSTKLLFSRGPSRMTGASAGVGGASSSNRAAAADTQRILMMMKTAFKIKIKIEI